MTRLRDLPLLAILPLGKLVLHEFHDAQRSLPISRAIEQSGILRNPPIVVPFQDGSGRYMVLDGANRTTALQHLNVPHIVAQVVAPDDDGLQLTPWNHVIWGMPSDALLEAFAALPHVELVSASRMDDLPQGRRRLGVFLHPDGAVYHLLTPHQRLIPFVQVLNNVVDVYKLRASLDRTQVTDVETLRALYPALSGVLMLPHFRIDEVLQVVAEGHLMPPGSTRFVVSPRALHLNYPLERLRSPESLREKNADLQEWVKERLARKAVRYYAEATYLFDE
ncbi:MAG: hypothetical protein D6803_02225 [Anaerolineae bacterium]|nr:MAG: hypothetical protein D6803_02225 [Anaerolineae bacterium]